MHTLTEIKAMPEAQVLSYLKNANEEELTALLTELEQLPPHELNQPYNLKLIICVQNEVIQKMMSLLKVTKEATSCES